MKSHRGHVARNQDERGILSAFVAVMALVLFVVAGLTIDTGRAIVAQRLAADEVEQAARTGAGQVSVQALRSGRVVLDDTAAVRVAETYMVVSGHPGVATTRGGVVTAKVSIQIPTSILGIIGVADLRVSATASASDVVGITRNN
jgi:Flp pilus assembly protein TadG